MPRRPHLPEWQVTPNVSPGVEPPRYFLFDERYAHVQLQRPTETTDIGSGSNQKLHKSQPPLFSEDQVTYQVSKLLQTSILF